MKPIAAYSVFLALSGRGYFAAGALSASFTRAITSGGVFARSATRALHFLTGHQRYVELQLLGLGKECRVLRRRVEGTAQRRHALRGTSGETKNGRENSARANTSRIA